MSTAAFSLTPAIRDRARGALIGTAICDALGAAVEFCKPGTFPPVTADAFERWSD
jgi:ADP-ribosylglycohydrolase